MKENTGETDIDRGNKILGKFMGWKERTTYHTPFGLYTASELKFDTDFKWVRLAIDKLNESRSVYYDVPKIVVETDIQKTFRHCVKSAENYFRSLVRLGESNKTLQAFMGKGHEKTVFYSSWDKLMPMIQRIQSLTVDGMAVHVSVKEECSTVSLSGDKVVLSGKKGYNYKTINDPAGGGFVKTHLRHCSKHKTPLESTYQAIVAFLEWFTKNAKIYK